MHLAPAESNSASTTLSHLTRLLAISGSAIMEKDISDTAFQRALRRFREGLTEDQRQQFATATLDNVRVEIGHIQNRYGPAKRLRNLNRLSRFLEAMSQFEQLAVIFLNVSEVVAFIWVR